MPETRLTEIVQALDDQEFEVKLAAIEHAYAEDAGRQELLVGTVEMLKEAEVAGEIEPLTDSQMLSLATQLVEDHMAKEAGEEYGEEETEELTEDQEVELFELGKLASEALQGAGMTAEDAAAVETDEESEALGRLAANILYAAEDEE